MRYQLEVPILAHEQLAECEFELTMRSPEIAGAARPGQFLQVLYDQSFNPFTRRPFSVFQVDREKGTFSIVYLARGVFTLGLRRKRPGEMLSVVGPLGNWFEPPEDRETRHILVAGGVGAPPLYLLANQMIGAGFPSERMRVINGARSKGLLVGMREFGEIGVPLSVTTNDGSMGREGTVLDELAVALAGMERPVQVYTCGPTPMLRAVAEICIQTGIPCQVSVETMMPCGLGVCMGCVVAIRDGSAPEGRRMLRSCYEGPVFRAEEILWDA